MLPASLRVLPAFRFCLHVISALLFCFAAPAHAVASDTPAFCGDSFVFREWFVEDGLPHNLVNAIVRDQRGFLWVGTLGGLARFDGSQFVEYRVPEKFALGGYNIRALVVEDEHTLVLVTGGNKLVRLREGVFELHPASAFLDDVQLRDLGLDASGTLWIGTDAPSVMRWDGKHLKTFAAEAGITSRGGGFCFVPDSEGRMWISGGDFLGYYDGTSLHTYEGEAGHSIIIAPTRSGGVWIAARQHLAKLENGKLTMVMSGKEWPALQFGIRDLFEATDGTLWIVARRDRIFRLSQGSLERVPLRNERVLSIADDIDGNIWLGTNGSGLVRAKPRHHVLLNRLSGMPTDLSTSLCDDASGALWCANQSGGLVRVKDNQITIAKVERGERQPYVSNVCPDQQGRIWAGTIGGLFWTTVTDNNEDRILRRYPVQTPNVQSLFCATNNDLWVSWDYKHLGVLHEGNWREFTKTEEFPGGRVAGIVEREDNEIWIGLEQGRLFRLKKNETHLEEIPLPADIHSTRLLTLFVDSGKRLWLGTTYGLLLWRDTQSHLFTRAHGLPDELISQIVEDDHKRLWVSSRRGIFYVSIEQLLTAAETTGTRITATLLGRDENLAGISGMPGGQPMAWKANDGRVWFITYLGLLGFNSPNPNDVRKPLPLYIDNISANSQSLPNAPLSPKAEIRIPSSAASLTVHFAALNFSTPDRTRVRRILEGYDLDWVVAGNERSATYPRLPPGHYVYRVQAGDTDGGMQLSEATVTLIVPAAWWQTPWARLCALIAFAAIVASCARIVSNRLLKRRLRRLEHENALERERSRIARDLHDDLGGCMTKIGFVAERLQRQSTDPVQKDQLGRLVSLARHLMEDLHRIIWTVNPKNDSWQQLAAYIARYTQRHLCDTGIICTVEGVETIPNQPLTPEVRNHLIALVKETLNNMLKHAKADRASITLFTHDDSFHMRIEDNGRGFDMNDASNNEGNGLANMRDRIAEMEGHIDIASSPAQGTRINVEVSLHCKTSQRHRVTADTQHARRHAHLHSNR